MTVGGTCRCGWEVMRRHNQAEEKEWQGGGEGEEGAKGWRRGGGVWCEGAWEKKMGICD